MQDAVRTTIRIRKDLLRQSKSLALHRGTSLQQVINDTLASGFKHVSDLNSHVQAMARIDEFRESLKGRKINIRELLEENKKTLQDRANRLINSE